VTTQEVLVFYMPMEFYKLSPIYPTYIMGIYLLSLSHIEFLSLDEVLRALVKFDLFWDFDSLSKEERKTK
jgi:hypothetical protein